MAIKKEIIVRMMTDRGGADTWVGPKEAHLESDVEVKAIFIVLERKCKMESKDTVLQSKEQKKMGGEAQPLKRKGHVCLDRTCIYP